MLGTMGQERLCGMCEVQQVREVVQQGFHIDLRNVGVWFKV